MRRGTAGGGAGAEAPLYVDKTQAVARVGDVLVIVSLDEPTPAMFEDLADETKDLASRGFRPGIFVLVDAAGEPPGELARASMRRFFTGVSSSCAALACFVEGEGFAAATKRSVMTLVVMATRAAFPVKVFGSSLEAASWLLERSGRPGSKGPGPAELVSAAETLRVRLSRGALPPRRRPR